MKIIIKEDTESLGSIGQVVKVADGYARNYLIPKGIALEANKGNLRQFESMKEAILKKNAKVKGSAEELGARLSAKKLVFLRKAGEDDKLFGSVTNIDVAAELKKNGLEVDRRTITIHEHIKHTGEFKVSIKLHPEVTAELDITVSKEEAGE